ncbi:hypothetical protein J6590_028132 [Homalodisca vitripennis]|nr:hypothetical protein J6590_028132 [Homalodisca vitripennis]
MPSSGGNVSSIASRYSWQCNCALIPRRYVSLFTIEVQPGGVTTPEVGECQVPAVMCHRSPPDTAGSLTAPLYRAASLRETRRSVLNSIERLTAPRRYRRRRLLFLEQ